jgi:hypothetical protein
MEIILKPKAQKALLLIGAFVEEKNTKGSGIKYIERFSLKLQSYAKENTQYALCNNKTLADLVYSGIAINKWIIAFKI